MTDTLSPDERSKHMSRIKGKDTKAELKLRRLVHGMGYRYRLHVRKLPGIPDLVFTKKRAIILFHGCFWHRHENCRLARLPKSRLDFWEKKLEGNRLRDIAVQKELRESGWRVLVIWECQLENIDQVKRMVQCFLETEGTEHDEIR